MDFPSGDEQPEPISNPTGPWRMWAIVDEGVYQHFGTKEHALARGRRRPLEVELTEDPAGLYWGWLDTDGANPRSIYLAEFLFSMCFPDGPEAAEQAGLGRILHLSVEQV